MDSSVVAARTVGWTAGSFTLDPVTVDIGAGRLVAIIGPSGAGKTTLLELLAGVRRPTSGTVRHPREVGFVPQDDIVHLHLPLHRTLSYAARLRGEETAVDEVLATLGLEHRRTARVATLSGGERKRASIAVELLANPQALFLDEPTSGLDPATSRDLLAHLRSSIYHGGGLRPPGGEPGAVAPEPAGRPVRCGAVGGGGAAGVLAAPVGVACRAGRRVARPGSVDPGHPRRVARHDRPDVSHALSARGVRSRRSGPQHHRHDPVLDRVRWVLLRSHLRPLPDL